MRKGGASGKMKEANGSKTKWDQAEVTFQWTIVILPPPPSAKDSADKNKHQPILDRSGPNYLTT